MVEEYSRRDMINAGGAGIAIALAGCADNDSEPNNTPETTTNDSGYEVTGYEVEDNLDDLEDGEELEITAKRVLENQDGDKKTEELETSGYQVKGETIRYHEQVENSTLKEAGLYKDLQDTVEQNDDSYSFSANDLIAGKNLLTLQIEINDEEYGKQETYQDTGEIQVSKSQEETLKDVLVEDDEIYDQLRDKFRSERIGKWMEIAEETREESGYEKAETTEEQYQEIADTWIEKAAEEIGGAPSGQANYLADTLEHINNDTVAAQLSNRGHNTVLSINEKENKAYHVDTGAFGRTSTPPGDAHWPSRNPEETPLMSPEHRLNMAKATLRSLMQITRDNRMDGRNIAEETAVSAMKNLRESQNNQEILDFVKTAGATMELSPTIELETEGEITNAQLKTFS